MLDLFSSAMVSAWLSMANVTSSISATVANFKNVPWVETGSSDADPASQEILQQYLKGLADKGLTPTTQGVWLQSGPIVLANNQGSTPLPAASLTKVATSLVALDTWGPDHRFETLIGTTGQIQQGVLNGDLIIKGGGDPLFVWEGAFSIGNTLNQMGIRKVAGNLVIAGNFAMNFETKPEKAGELLKEALNSGAWSQDAAYQFQQLPQGTPKPEVAIAGSVIVVPESSLPPNQTLLMRHQSLPLAQMLKLMNIYSNNVMSESLAEMAGGATAVAQKAAVLAGVPPEEILLANGSGLGVENRISPRAICAMFAAIQRYLEPRNMTIADLFAISGTDVGTIEDRKIPTASVVKTGTLNDVSALAGVLPTRDRGLVWFTIINRGGDLEGLRAQQDELLQQLVNQWGTVQPAPTAIAPRHPLQTTALLKAANRDEILFKPAMQVDSKQ